MATRTRAQLSGNQEIDQVLIAAYNKQVTAGIRDKDTLVEAMISEAEACGLFSLENNRRVWGEYISSRWFSTKALQKHAMLSSRKKDAEKRRADAVAAGIEPEPEQMSLFEEEALDICYSVAIGDAQEVWELGQFRVEHIDAKLKGDAKEIESRSRSYEEFRDAASLVRDLLVARPAWTWRDAARHLRSPS